MVGNICSKVKDKTYLTIYSSIFWCRNIQKSNVGVVGIKQKRLINTILLEVSICKQKLPQG